MAWLRWRHDASAGQGLSTCRVCMEGRGEHTWCGACEAVELWPENVASVDLYLAVETQWQRAGMDGTPTGLDYAGVAAAMQLRGDPPHRFDDIQVLEREFLAILSQQRAKSAKPPVQPHPNVTREILSHG